MDLNSQIIEAMFKVSRLMREGMVFDSKVVHLSMLQVQVLGFLKKNENAKMSEIAEHFKVELPTATSLLNKLYAMKLVNRNADEQDRRVIRISLTGQGKDLLLEAMSLHNKKIGKVLSYLSEEDKKNLLAILKNLGQKMEAVYEST